MLKTLFSSVVSCPVVVGTVLVGLLLVGSPLLGQSVAQLTPTRVIQVDPSRELDGQASRQVDAKDASRGNTERIESVVSSVSLSAEGNLLAVAGDDHLVRIFDTSSAGRLYRLATHAD
ncbi:MAG TPA: hypothetical protein VE890_11050 [Thermoguttaceae bacterium]|nr:hypothetical protein [Thermoguttaceae bacterium]